MSTNGHLETNLLLQFTLLKFVACFRTDEMVLESFALDTIYFRMLESLLLEFSKTCTKGFSPKYFHRNIFAEVFSLKLYSIKMFAFNVYWLYTISFSPDFYSKIQNYLLKINPRKGTFPWRTIKFIMSLLVANHGGISQRQYSKQITEG